MFPDPNSVTISGAPVSLPRIESQGRRSIYSNADGTVILTISHSNPSPDRVRTMVRLDKKAVVPDPITSVNDYENLGVYFVIDRPIAGFSDAIVDAHIQALKGLLTTATNTKLYGGES